MASDGTELDAFVQIGVAKEDQPHYLKVIARPGADVSDLIGFALGSIAARTGGDAGPAPGPGGHRAGPDLRIADR